MTALTADEAHKQAEDIMGDTKTGILRKYVRLSALAGKTVNALYDAEKALAEAMPAAPAVVDAEPVSPAGSIETNRITIVAYIDDAGQNGYAVRTVGDGAMSTYLGLLVIGQRDVLAWGAPGKAT